MASRVTRWSRSEPRRATTQPSSTRRCVTPACACARCELHRKRGCVQALLCVTPPGVGQAGLTVVFGARLGTPCVSARGRADLSRWACERTGAGTVCLRAAGRRGGGHRRRPHFGSARGGGAERARGSSHSPVARAGGTVITLTGRYFGTIAAQASVSIGACSLVPGLSVTLYALCRCPGCQSSSRVSSPRFCCI